MKSYLTKRLIILFSCIYLFESKVNVKITIYNYENHDNLLHNGHKCESFHWAGDHCDPMFKICIYGRYSCDLFYKSTNFWANKKYVNNILSTTIQSNDFQKIIRIMVDVNDHDRFDEHDYIGVFRATFFIGQTNFDRQVEMDYGPRNLNIRLKARIQVSCAQNYYGQYCDTYCLSTYNYACSQYDGSKICSKFYYGSDCNVRCIPGIYYSCSPKTGEKICKATCISQNSCTYSIYNKKFLCKCYKNWYMHTCYAERLPYFSTVSMKRTKLQSRTKSTKIMKSVTTFQSKITSSLPIYANNLSKSKKYFLNKKSIVSVISSTIRPTNSRNTKHPNFIKTKSTKIYVKEITNNKISSTIYNKSNHLMINNNIEAEASNLKSFKSTDNEKSRSQGNTGIMQVVYAIPIVLLVLISLCVLLRYWKLKYKLRYLEHSQTKEIAHPIIYRRNLQFENNSKFPPDENPYADLNSLYDSCTLTTNINDEVYYEEPINKVNNKYQNHF